MKVGPRTVVYSLTTVEYYAILYPYMEATPQSIARDQAKRAVQHFYSPQEWLLHVLTHGGWVLISPPGSYDPVHIVTFEQLLVNNLRLQLRSSDRDIIITIRSEDKHIHLGDISISVHTSQERMNSVIHKLLRSAYTKDQLQRNS